MWKRIGDLLARRSAGILVLAFPFGLAGQDAAVRASVDQTVVAVGQQFTLSV